MAAGVSILVVLGALGASPLAVSQSVDPPAEPLPRPVLLREETETPTTPDWFQQTNGLFNLVPVPTLGDADGDGLSDADEGIQGTDPLDLDSDNDLLVDGDEVIAWFTDPLDWDTDGDGVADYVETGYGMDALGSDGAFDTDNDGYDADGDGTVDFTWRGFEEYGFHRPNDWDEPTQGPWLFGTNPTHHDSDSDGIPDATEVFNGFDPTVFEQAPDAAADGDPAVHPMGDEDGDGLVYAEEFAFGSSPFDKDTDGDGLCDGPLGPSCADLVGSEPDFASSPVKADTDGDGLPDGTEAIIWSFLAGALAESSTGPPKAFLDLDVDLDNLPGVVDDDNDGDGLSDGAEFLGAGNMALLDTDGDGFTDGQEVGLGLDPELPDTDLDGIPDKQEYRVLATGPLSPDTDGDGLLDGVEFQVLHTNPREADTDFDGVPDGTEVAWGLNPNVQDTYVDHDKDWLLTIDEYFLGTLPFRWDSSGDGMSDGWEVRFGFTPTAWKFPTSDADSDGLPDYREYETGGRPVLADSDGDGMSDGAEYNTYGTDLLDYDTDEDGLSDQRELLLWNTISSTAWNTVYHPVDVPLPAHCGIELPVWELLWPHDPSTGHRWPPLTTDPCQLEGGVLCTGPSNLHCPDSDGDGLSDRDEFIVTKTSPADPLSNGDALPSTSVPLTDLVWALAVQHGHFLATVGDADGDQLPDTFETGTMLSDPFSSDTDCDGVGDYFEYQMLEPTWMPPGAKPWLDADYDDDGVPDGTEVNLFARNPTYAFYTHPYAMDTDGDEISDNDEDPYFVPIATTCGTVPLLAPTPMSTSLTGNLFDFVTILQSNLDSTPLDVISNPMLPDSDFDGVPDVEELSKGTGPLDCDSEPGDDLLGDGLELGKGVHFGITPYSPDDQCTQFDTDGQQSDPLDRNSDGDLCGLIDGLEDPGHDGAVSIHEDGDPNDLDSDGDGINDCDEWGALLRVSSIEKDEKLYCMTDPDCDGDGVPDGLEGLTGAITDPTLGNPTGHAYWKDFPVDSDDLPAFKDADQDDDFVTDAVEANGALPGFAYSNVDGDVAADPTNPGVTLPQQNIIDTDSDDDGLPDALELTGTLGKSIPTLDPNDADFDDDGVIDGLDIQPFRKEGIESLLEIDFGQLGINDNVDWELTWYGCGDKTKNGEPYLSLLRISKDQSSEALPLVELDKGYLKPLTYHGSIGKDGIEPDLSTTWLDFLSVDPTELLDHDLSGYEIRRPEAQVLLFARLRLEELELDGVDCDQPREADQLDISPIRGQADWTHAFTLEDLKGTTSGGTDSFEMSGATDGGGDHDDATLVISTKSFMVASHVADIVTHSCALSRAEVADPHLCNGSSPA